MSIHTSDSRLTMARRYVSALRDEHAAQTRQRIVDAVIRVLLDSGPAGITIPAVASAAKVSPTTVYRLFPTKEALVDSVTLKDVSELTRDFDPRSPSQLADAVTVAYGRFREHEAFLRASALTPAGRELRARNPAARRRPFEQALGSVTEKLEPDDRARLEALILLLVSATGYLHLLDRGQLEHDDAVDAAAWAVEVLCRAAARQGRARRA